MSLDEIREFVTCLLERHGPLPAGSRESIDSYGYLDAGHIDSFSILKFVMEIEDHYGLTLEADDLQSPSFRTVGGLCRLIDKRRAIG